MIADSPSEKLDPVDVAFVVIFQIVFSFFPNIILSFFSFGTAVGHVISALLAGVLVGLIRKGKRPPLAIPRERMRLARCATLVFLGLSLLVSVLASMGTDQSFRPPLLGAPVLEPKILWIVTLVGVPLEVFLIFLSLRLGLAMGAGGRPRIQTGQESAGKNVPTSLSALTNVLLVLLILTLASDAAEIVHSALILPVFSRTTEVPEILSRMSGVWWSWLAVLATCLSIATAVLFLLWLHQAYKNLYALGVQGMASTPGWAVGWWFVPVMNLFKPCQAFHQLWQASDPGVELQDPKSWKAASGSPLIPSWWGLWLLSLLNLKFSGTAVNAPNLKLLTWISLGTHAAHLLAGVLLILLVRAVSQRQGSIRKC